MEPLIIVLVPGLLGGLVIALLVVHFRPGRESAVRGRLEPPSPGLINMAHIRVDGVGGLGMVAMAITVAIFLPRIRLAMIMALLFGAALAAVLIALRRRTGPLASGNDHPGAHSIFGIEGLLERGPRAIVPPAPVNDDHRQSRKWTSSRCESGATG